MKRYFKDIYLNFNKLNHLKLKFVPWGYYQWIILILIPFINMLHVGSSVKALVIICVIQKFYLKF